MDIGDRLLPYAEHLAPADARATLLTSVAC